jgi:hypothetical protein
MSGINSLISDDDARTAARNRTRLDGWVIVDFDFDFLT